jgi:F-type H+-transporting ATPase subunit delta
MNRGSVVGKRYATALYELADENKVVDRIGKDLESLASAWQANDELRNVIESPSFKLEQKRAVVAALADKVGAHPLFKNMLLLLSDRRRLPYLPDIATAFERIAERRSGRVRAEVVSATKLPEAYYTELQKTLKAATGKDVVIVRREDPTLIAGVVTTVNGKVYDGSLANGLRELRAQLLRATDPAHAGRQ